MGISKKAKLRYAQQWKCCKHSFCFLFAKLKFGALLHSFIWANHIHGYSPIWASFCSLEKCSQNSNF